MEQIWICYLTLYQNGMLSRQTGGKDPAIRAIHFMHLYLFDSFEGKSLFQLYKYYKLNLFEEYFGVIRSRDFDLGNVG